MAKGPGYVKGDWRATCSLCGGSFLASQLRRHWQGQYRCSTCWEERHPQDFVRAVREDQSVPWSQPQWQTDIDLYVCDINGRSAFPGYAIPGCLMPGNTVLSLD